MLNFMQIKRNPYTDSFTLMISFVFSLEFVNEFHKNSYIIYKEKSVTLLHILFLTELDNTLVGPSFSLPASLQS